MNNQESENSQEDAGESVSPDTVCSAKVLHMLKCEIGRKNRLLSEFQRLSLDMLSMFQGNDEKIATEERVEAWEQKWNELTGLDYSDYI